jgi:hypothetical protein
MLLLSLPLVGSGCIGTVDNAADESGQVGEAVVGGTFEPNYKFPWEVSLNGCHGVLISPLWVLTAAHCVPTSWSHKVSYTRTDPYDGSVHSDYRMVTSSYGGAVYVHPGYVPGGGFSNPVNDIALIRVDSAFVIDPYIQTVAVPTTPSAVGMTGAIASGSSNGTPPAGDEAVMRTQIPSVNPSTCAPPAGAFCISSTSASLCSGDSGSGFVTVENGRAVVRGIASFINAASSCQSLGPYDYAALTDVSTFHDWILHTMAATDVTLAGANRVHASGRVAKGEVGIGCTSPYGTMYSPMNVPGTQVGTNCTPGDRETVVCSLAPGQSDPIRAQPVVITGFTMKQTNNTTGATSTTSLPIGSSTFATYYASVPLGVTQEFTCQIGLGSVVVGGGIVVK